MSAAWWSGPDRAVREGLARLLASPGRVVTVAALLLAGIVVGRGVVGERDLSRFVAAGDEFTNAAQTPVPIHVLPGSGYDGQFFYRLALDPWPEAQQAFGIHLDAPAYRHQRILYPLLAWILSAGDPARALATLVLINLLALLAIAFAFARIAGACGVASGYGLIPALFAGLILAFGRDLAEPLSGSLLAVAILASLQDRRMISIGALGFAVLSREPALLTASAFGFAVARGGEAERSGRMLLLALAPALLLLAWQGAVYRHWGALAVSAAMGVGPPLGGLLEVLPSMSRVSLENVVAGIELVWLAWLGWAAGRASASGTLLSGPRRFTFSWVRAAWFLWTLLLLCLPKQVWNDDWSFMRVSSEWALLGYALLLLSGRVPSPRLLIFTLGLFGLSFVRLVLRP